MLSTKPTTYAPWLAFFRLECVRAALSLEQSRTLEARILGVVQSDVLPQTLRQVLMGAPVLEVPWIASGYGIEAAAAGFEVTALTALLAGQVLQLEHTGIISPSVRASLEYSLGELLPNTAPMAQAAARGRLRAVIDCLPNGIKA